jgi:hypothetical protein
MSKIEKFASSFAGGITSRTRALDAAAQAHENS